MSAKQGSYAANVELCLQHRRESLERKNAARKVAIERSGKKTFFYRASKGCRRLDSYGGESS